MKNYLSLTILILFSFSVFAQSDYYYFKGKKIKLAINENLFYISSSDSTVFTSTLKNAYPISKKQSGKSQEKEIIQHWAIMELEGNNMNADVKSLLSKTLQNKYYIAPVIGKEHPIATSEFFYVKLKSENDYDKLLSCADKLNCDLCFLI